MAIIRTIDNSENTLNYVGSLSFLCAISCTIIMLWFRGFKATFNVSKNKQTNIIDDSPSVSLTGAYRINKDELFDNINHPNPPKNITPAMVSLPAAQSGYRKEISKSTSNLAHPTEKKYKTKSIPNIPEVAPEPLTKTQIKEAKKFDKNLLDERKKQAKIAAKEQEKAAKMRRERDKLMQIMKTKAEETKTKRISSQPPPKTENVQATPVIASRSEIQEPTNTLENISNSSGPPPYTPTKEGTPTIFNNTSNESDNIWDMVSQHRQQINRPQVVSSLPKQTHLDLNYNVDPKNDIDNSDA